MTRPLLPLALVASLVAGGAQAAEPYAVYDGFNTGTQINTSRWNQIDLSRRVNNGQLVLRQRNIGNQISDSSTLDTNHSMSFDEPDLITQMKSEITVTEWAATACTHNPTPSEARARLLGSFFNVGTPVPGSQLNDVLAQIRVYRRTNSALPAGTLNVEGLLLQCTNADCTTTSVIGAIQDLGTTTVGTMVRAQIDWDKPNKTFLFTRDTNPPVSVSYTQSDTALPGNRFKGLQTRTILANCFSGPRTEATIEARFDNVAVNASAAP